MLSVDSFSDFFGKYLTHTRVSFFTDAQEGAGNDFADAAGEWLGRVGRAAAPESVMRASSLLLYLRVVGVCSDSGELGREIACKASFEAARIVQYRIVEHVFVASLGPFLMPPSCVYPSFLKFSRVSWSIRVAILGGTELLRAFFTLSSIRIISPMSAIRCDQFTRTFMAIVPASATYT